MKKILFLLSAGIILMKPVIASKLTDILPFLEEKIKKAQEQFNTPGFAIAFIEGDQIRYMKGFGVRAYGQEELINTETLFQIGSVTKGMTATLIASLLSENILNLDDKIIKHFPDFKYCDEEHTQNLTIKDVLSHQSGLPGYAGDVDIQAGKYFQEVLPTLVDLTPIAPIKEKFSYQNVLYCVPGQIAEKALKKDINALFQEKLFNPLGLKNASLGIKALDTSYNKALSHKVGQTFTRVLPYSEFGYRIPYAGGINMSIEDLAKYALLHINKGKINGQAYIPENIIDELHKVQIDTTGTERRPYYKNFYPKERVKNTGYGLGWRIYDWGGQKAIGHGGFVNGQLSMISFLPDQKVGIVVLANAATPLGTTIRSYLFDRYLGLSDIDWLDRAKIIKARDKVQPTKKHQPKKAPHKKEIIKKEVIKKEMIQKKGPKKALPQKQITKKHIVQKRKIVKKD